MYKRIIGKVGAMLKHFNSEIAFYERIAEFGGRIEGSEETIALYSGVVILIREYLRTV
ncbi:MAG: hypothetical protein RSG54_08230 [Clostridium sp.]